jgi:hypothetical protein
MDHKTWEILLIMPYMHELFKLWLYVLLYQKVSKKNSKNKECVMEKIQFGPLLQKNSHATANNSIEMVPVWPSTPYEASATAACLSLCHKDQNHQVVRNDARLNWDVYLHQPYRNDYKV